MMARVNDLVVRVGLALNYNKGRLSAIYGVWVAVLAVTALTGCCGPWWFCEEHHHHHW
jgi:hypothetical protein